MGALTNAFQTLHVVYFRYLAQSRHSDHSIIAVMNYRYRPGADIDIPRSNSSNKRLGC